VNIYVYAQMKSTEAKRLLQSLGATFEPGKGGHLKVTLNGRRSILPMHGSKELASGTWRAIQKQLGLKEHK
jgi:mRNA interferase HicA